MSLKKQTLKDVKYVRLEPVCFVIEYANQVDWGCEEMGCYRILLDHLYTNGGYMEFDMKVMARMCRCSPRKFERIWNKIGNKFGHKGGLLHHKRVLYELKYSLGRMQTAYDSGVRGSEVRWGAHKGAHSNPSTAPNRGAIANEAKTRLDKGNTSNTKELVSGVSASIRVLDFLNKAPRLSPRTMSDRKAYNNFAKWVQRAVEKGMYKELDIVSRVKHIVVEASGDNIKNHHAMFFSLVKKDLGYSPKKGVK